MKNSPEGKMSITDLLKLVEQIERVNNNPNAVIMVKDDSQKKNDKTEKKKLTAEELAKLKQESQNRVQFSPQEKELMIEHKEFFIKSGHSKIAEFLGENINVINNKQDTNEKEKFESFFKTLIEFTNENSALKDDELTKSIDKIYKLCSDESRPGSVIYNAVKFIGKHAESGAKQPIHDLCMFFKLPKNTEWNREGWLEYGLKSDKQGLKLLARADVIQQELDKDRNASIEKAPNKAEANKIRKTLGKAASSYKEGLEAAIKVGYKRSYEIDILDGTKLSNGLTKEKLKEFSELCIIKGIKEEAYNIGLNVLLDPKLKTTDNLPDIIIDGKDLGDEKDSKFLTEKYPKYYMAKLPLGDPRGLMLGELTNCCQSIGNNAEEAAIDGMQNENSGFYAIFEKEDGKKIDIKNDRIIAQSYAWIGQPTMGGGKTLVLDSWERLGKNNDKLLDPFYSKFVDIIGKNHNISKVSIGTGGNTPKNILYRKDETPTKFQGIAPYGDAAKQYVILDKDKGIYPYDEKTEAERLYILFIDAINNNKLELVKDLLNQGADVDARDFISDYNKNTVLISACMRGYTEIVQVLLENNADVDVKNSYRQTALTQACENGHYEIVKLFIKNGHDIKSKNEILHVACENGHMAIVEFLAQNGADIEYEDLYQDTAFIKACRYGHIKIVKFLAENGANIEAKNSSWETALIEACQNGHIEVVKFLMQNGADINVQNAKQETALIKAKRYGHTDIVDFLVASGAKTEDKERKQETSQIKITTVTNLYDPYETELPVYGAGRVEIEQEYTENVYEETNNDKVFFEACIDGDIEKVKSLIDKDLNIEHQNPFGETALIVASKKGHIEVVKLLLEKNADLNIKNFFGKTAVDYAKEPEMQKLFSEAKLNAKLEDKIEHALEDLSQNSNFQEVLEKNKLTKYVDNNPEIEKLFKEQAKKIGENLANNSMTHAHDESKAKLSTRDIIAQLKATDKFNTAVTNKINKPRPGAKI